MVKGLGCPAGNCGGWMLQRMQFIEYHLGYRAFFLVRRKRGVRKSFDK
jgi:hypothetical protein